MAIRGIRGATTVENNDSTDIINSTIELLKEMIDANGIIKEDAASIIFTVTADLNAAFPAVAARQIGYTDVALMCMNEINVQGSLQKCIRILIHINTEKENKDLKHIYLNKAKALRPDLVTDS